MSKVSLGQYYTPAPLATWMVSLAQSAKDASVLEPSCGEGVFLEALAKNGYKNVSAFEIDPSASKIASKENKGVRVVNQSFLDAPLQENYDLIIGNPPYVKWGNIPAKTKKTLQEDLFWKGLSSGEWDLLYAFLIGSAKMLRPGGEMIFIVPYNWFSATHARPVRECLLREGCFSDIIHFGEQKLFKDAAPNAIVFRWQKNKGKNKVRAIDFQGSAEKNPLSRAEGLRQALLSGKEKDEGEWRAFFAEQFQSADSWHLASSRESAFCQKVESLAALPLKDKAAVAVGMVSGLDRAFILESRDNFSAKERQFLFPFVKARNCKLFFISSPSYFIWADAIETEDQLKKLPNIYKHLLPFKEKLLKRYGKQEWWQWATVRNKKLLLDNLQKPKIFLPCTDRAERARFSITQKPYLASGDVLVIVPIKDPWGLQAWLASLVFNEWYKIKGPKGGQRRKYTQAFLESAPCPSAIPKEAGALAKALSKEPDQTKREKLLKENDALFLKILSEAPNL